MSATERAVQFICESREDSFPAEAREVARRAILDTVGVILAGTTEPSARIVREVLAEDGEQGMATILGTGQRAAATSAALANGTAGHALDYDDVTANMMGHPSIPLTPAVLAAAEIVGASGAEAVSAFLVGFEVECKVGRGLGQSHYGRGFHETATVGALGSAAACAHLWKLDAEQTAHALAIASTMAGGLRTNFGSMSKPLHAGNAARAGVQAAQLARRGFTGGQDVLDGPLGFVRLFSPADDSDIEQVDGFGDPWEVLNPGISVKKYACCFVSHRAADAALNLVAQHSPDPDQIERVEVHLPGGTVSAAGGVGPMIHPRPQTGLQGKFSMQYVIASALHDRGLKLATFEDEAVRRPELQALLQRVQPLNDATRHPAARSDQYSVVEIYLKDGSVLTDSVTEPRGGPSDPLSWEELLEKYHDCASLVLPGDRVDRSAELLSELDDVADVRDLTAVLVG